MRYSTFFKFVAFVLCAASLLGMVGSAAGLVCLTNLGSKSVDQAYCDQLENQALNYALAAGQDFASRELGGASDSLIHQSIGGDWESAYFSWTRVGYAISDSGGNVLQGHTLPDDSYEAAHIFDFPMMGQYIKVLTTAPYEEHYPPATEPVLLEENHIYVMPAQEMTPIGAVYIRYTDGHQTEWGPDTVWGTLWYHGGNTLTFESNEIGSIPAGDGWYPSYIRLEDLGGNVVYEAEKDGCIFMGEEQDGTFYKIHLPSGSVTSAAPAGITFTDGNYTSYDAIPTQGVTINQMTITYANAQGEVMGSEGISSPDLIGTLFHNADGNAEFQSNEAMDLDIPAGSRITHISFMDTQHNLIFEASCPDGVGVIGYENDTLIFQGQIPGTEEPQETLKPAWPYASEDNYEGQIGHTLMQTEVYTMPSTQARVVTTLQPGQQVLILTQVPYATGSEERAWGMIEEGWLLMDHISLSNETLPLGRSADPAETPAAEETAPAEAAAAPAPTGSPEADLPDAAPEEGIRAVAAQETTEPEPRAIEETEAPASAYEEETLPAETYPAEDVEKIIYYDGQKMVAEYVWETIPDGYTVTVSLAPGALRDELSWTLLQLAQSLRHILLEALGICIAVFALCVIHLCCSAGRTRRDNAVQAGGLNRIPLDLYLCVGGSGVTGLVAAAFYGSEYFARNDQQLAILFCGACAYFASLLLVAFFFACVAQFKTPGGYWWRNSLCGRCLGLTARSWRWLKKQGFTRVPGIFRRLRRSGAALWHFGRNTALWLWDTFSRLFLWASSGLGRCFRWSAARLARFFGMLPITWQFLITGFALVFFLYVMMRSYKVGYILLGFGVFFAVILYAASAFAILLENARRMSKGDLDSKVDDRLLIGGFREFARRLNDLAGVAVIAAQKQLKSERMKTELITNVSHDIKTPLTSIINYVDLLKKPHTEDQQAQYLEVLDRQSQRLKKLIDDLMEMSKASTGNVNLEISTVNAGEAVNQALGEFADKLEKVPLTPVFRQPDDPVYMLADGKLVWRVMSNLLGNAVKYALPGTRIYIDLLEMDGKVIISLKNISREELNVHADELMERFVRGDASRNTEGSGLGLNIAQNLMELQKGQLQILVDGDLFKVTLIFPAA